MKMLEQRILAQLSPVKRSEIPLHFVEHFKGVIKASYNILILIKKLFNILSFVTMNS